MDFSNALESLKYDGSRVCRKGWNGKGMWISLCKEYATYDIPFNVDFDARLNRKKASFYNNENSRRLFSPLVGKSNRYISKRLGNNRELIMKTK